ncbi:MAG: leucine-rich repeat protein [Oscillospiraceae bacterium]|nr:leucine-rich repeat protein [Oscillospiraceae bacterium]
MAKRVFSLLLALVMVIGMLPATANAASLDNGLVYQVYADHVEITDYTGDATEVVIPAEIEGLPVTVIGRSAFNSCTNLTSITIPDSVTSIGSYAFYQCSSLTSISIPQSVTTIGDGICSECTSLTGIYVDENNPNYSSDDRGVLFNKEKTELILAPGTIEGSYEIPSGVSLIHENAFLNCARLTHVTIPYGITSIDTRTFSGCSALTSITIPESVTYLGYTAFSGCSSLIDISIPDSVTAIGGWAFHGCTRLTSVYIPRSVVFIDGDVFMGCSNLTGIHVDENNPNYSNDAQGVLYNKDKTTLIQALGVITEYTVPDSVVTIGERSFYGCSNLTNISLPDSVVAIEPAAFEYCTGLTNITIPKNVTSIGSSAFYGCKGMFSIMFEGDAPKIDQNAFYSVSATACYPTGNATWTNTVRKGYGGKLTWVSYSPTHDHAYTAVVTAPTCTSQGFTTCICECGASYRIDYVDALGHEYKNFFCIRCNAIDTNLRYTVYADHVEITSYYGRETEIVIPAKIERKPVTVIGDYAFAYSSNLTSIELPYTLTAIESEAFYHCTDLVTISIPDGVTYIASSAFEGCTSLVSVSIPDSVGSIGISAFYDCTSLDNVTIPDSVTSIGIYAFAGCYSLTSIFIPDSVDFIGVSAFGDCRGLNEIRVHKNNPNFSSDDRGVLFNKQKTTLIQAPGTLTDYTVPDSVTTIGDSAFVGCLGLTSISIPDSVTTIIDGAFFNCSSLTSISIPNSVTAIDGYTFQYCTSLTSIELPDSITSIGEYAFYGCTGLTSISIPKNVTSIMNGTFFSCSGLTSITFLGDAPQFGDNVFRDVTATVYYPSDNTTWTENIMLNYGGQITWASQTSTHSHEYNAVVIAPACAALGYTSYICECGAHYAVDYVDALGHDYADGVCTRCGWVDIGLQYLVYSDHVEITGCSENVTDVVIPAVIEGKPVTTICDWTFWGCSNLTSIFIPDSVTSIIDPYFINNPSINRFQVDENNPNYSSDDRGVLFNKAKTELIRAPGGITGSYAIPYGVTSFSESAFSGCTSLTSISIPNSLTSTVEGVFSGCTSLTSIDFPNNFVSIGHRSFSSCTSLTTITIPSRVTSIGNYAFSDCSSLTSITFKGGAPKFFSNTFLDITAAAYYPANNSTWTTDVMQHYGGTITWVPYIPTTPPNPFTDVPAGSFYEVPVLWALENDITTGISPTTFSPDDQCIRAQVVTFLWRAEGTPAPNSAVNPYSDVNPGSYFYNPVLWAVENKITTGLSATHFGSNEVCNRAQVVTFLWRAAGCPEPSSTDDPFADVSPTDYYYKPVLWALESGITTGLSPNHFGAAAPCNRAQVVTFLYRAYN